MKVEQFYNKNQFKVTDGQRVFFQSYKSMIAKIEDKKLTLGHDWDYSKTTTKRLYMFLSENRYSLTLELREQIETALEQTNKRKAIQALIECGFIQYDKNM